MADKFTTTTYVPAPEGAPIVLTTQDLPLSRMLTQYYGQEQSATGGSMSAASTGQASGANSTGRGSKPTSGNRFHYFVACASPRIPHTRITDKPLTVALASDAAVQIREQISNTARLFMNHNYTSGSPADLVTYASPLCSTRSTRVLSVS
jgi:hypothetical protein